MKNSKSFEMKNNEVRVVSLCSGAGFLDKGFYEAGFKFKFAIEQQKDVADTYAANFGKHIVHGDLMEYPIDAIPDAEVCIAYLPCYEFLFARNMDKLPSYALDDKGIDVMKNMKSLKVFVIETVTALLERGNIFMDKLTSEMSDFDITVNIVDSSKHGSAQKKKRAIIIGSKIGKIELPESTSAAKTVREAFEGLTDETPNQLDYPTKMSDIMLEKVKLIPQGGDMRDLPKELKGKGIENSVMLYRLPLDETSRSILHARKCMTLHPEEDRILSVRECARLFDLYPEKDGSEFIFEGPLYSKYHMLSIATPVSISRVVANSIKEKFNEVYNEEYSFDYKADVNMA